MALNITLPQSWQELTDDQLEYVLYLLAKGYDADTLRAYCFVRFSGVDTIELPPVQVAELLPCLDYLTELPEYPIRPETIGKHRKAAYDALCRDMTFDTYLACENFYQGYIHTQRQDLLDKMAAVLYPIVGNVSNVADNGRSETSATNGRSETSATNGELHVAVLYWWAGLKAYLSRRFTHFFRPADPHSGTANAIAYPDLRGELQQSMDAQIRALTGGDITKNPVVLATDYLTCLTELDAKAREAEEMERIMRGKK